MSTITTHTKHSCSVCRDLKPELASVEKKKEQSASGSPESDSTSRRGSSPLGDTVSLLYIRASADRGCHGCRVLTAIMSPYWDAFGLGEACSWTYSMSEGVFTMQVFRCIESYWGFLTDVEWAGTLQMWTITRESILQPLTTRCYLLLLTLTARTCPWGLTTPAFDVDPRTSEDKAIEKIREWLKQCHETHEKCRSVAQTPRLPTRVVEILGAEEVRLREHVDDQAPYVCLSHCWGTAGFLQTNADTISEHKKSIAWSKLPKTFQDAISVTYQLGLRYIWIDSLCIVQVSVTATSHTDVH